jgi:hypothetical protein
LCFASRLFVKAGYGLQASAIRQLLYQTPQVMLNAAKQEDVGSETLRRGDGDKQTSATIASGDTEARVYHSGPVELCVGFLQKLGKNWWSCSVE